jgi:hypothetical protein
MGLIGLFASNGFYFGLPNAYLKYFFMLTGAGGGDLF